MVQSCRRRLSLAKATYRSKLPPVAHLEQNGHPLCHSTLMRY
jgi:hypothetical protein